MKNSFFLILLFAGFLGVACGGDDASDCTQAQFSTEVNAAINNLNVAGNAYANDPTNTTLCNNFKDAANGYLDAVQKFEGCGVIAQSDYDAQIQAARDAINSIAGC